MLSTAESASVRIIKPPPAAPWAAAAARTQSCSPPPDPAPSPIGPRTAPSPTALHLAPIQEDPSNGPNLSQDPFLCRGTATASYEDLTEPRPLHSLRPHTFHPHRQKHSDSLETVC